MSDLNNMLEGTKILSLTDANGRAHEFISETEQEKAGFKLKYYMWLSRLFILFAIVSLLVFMSTSLAIFKLAPQVTVEPFLIINQDTSDGIVRAEAITNRMASKNQLMETFVQQYVILRNTIINDEREMQTRWYPGGMLSFLSSPRVYNEFTQYRESIWGQIRHDGVVREVEIISIGKLGGERSPVWKVDFKTYELSQNWSSDVCSSDLELSQNAVDQKTKARILSVRYWTASVTAFFIPGREFVGLRLINPIGFTVVRYSQAEVEIL